MNDKIILVCVDGSVIGARKGPAGWAAMVDGEMYSGVMPLIVGNNTAELYAILEGLNQCPARSKVLLWTDSKWALRWLNGKPIYDLNIRTIRLAIEDVIESLELDVHWELVKGHHTNEIHNRVDREANKQAKLAYEEIYG